MKLPTLALLIASQFTSAENWPRFRGENGAGVSKTEVPTSFEKDTLKWSAKLPGPGSSSPVIWNDKLFITGENRDKKTISLICLHAKTGKPNWTKELSVGNYHLHRFNNTAAATPAVSEKSVVVSWYNASEKIGMVSAFAHDGEKQWDFKVGPHETQHGINLHPVIHEGKVIICNLHMEDGYVGAIALDTGKEIWKTPYPGDKTSYVTPYIHETAAGKEVIVASQAIGVVGLNFKSGKEKWSLPGTMKQRTIVSPINVLAGSNSKDCLVAVGCKNGVYFAVRPPADKEKAEIVWKMKGNTPYVPTPVSDGKTVFALSDNGGMLTALDALTGEKHWQEQMKANFYASPLLAGGKLYALSREGEMIVADVSNSYQELSRTSLELGPEAQWADATPALSNGKIYVRMGARLDCFGKK